jgi:hypothetical protein
VTKITTVIIFIINFHFYIIRVNVIGKLREGNFRIVMNP